ncbi:MAG: sugar transferase [Thermoanaerobaculia bacterium]
MKRLLDLAAAGLLTALCLPLGLVIAVVLRLTGEGEVFYAQRRVGRNGEPFRLLKFVTMVRNSAKMGGTVTLPGDPRVLPVGRVLRKLKLNELPQLLNVLRGDMSLVGPRPLTPATFACYPPEVQRRVVGVQPGLTGVGSIVFRDEERIIGRSELPPIDCYRQEIAPYKGRLELWYIDNRSLWLDIKLILLTAVAVLAPRSRLHERLLQAPFGPYGSADGAVE